MNEMSEMTDRRSPRTPPRWANRVMSWALRTPGLQRVAGRGTALVTVTGRRSGRRYTTPVSYTRDGDRIIVVSSRGRTWWRNVADRPSIDLRLAGSDRHGSARLVRSEDSGAVDLLRTYLAQQHMAARAQGVRRDANGALREDDLRRVLADTVVIEIRLDGA